MAGPALNEITIILQLEERGNHHLIPGVFFVFLLNIYNEIVLYRLNPFQKSQKAAKKFQ